MRVIPTEKDSVTLKKNSLILTIVKLLPSRFSTAILDQFDALDWIREQLVTDATEGSAQKAFRCFNLIGSDTQWHSRLKGTPSVSYTARNII